MLREQAQTRYCERALADVVRLAADGNIHRCERFDKVADLIKQRGKEYADCFDYLRRSTADIQLLFMYTRDLLTPEEKARLSPELQENIRRCLSR